MPQNDQQKAMLDSQITSRDKSTRMMFGLVMCTGAVIAVISIMTIFFGMIGFWLSIPFSIFVVGGMVQPGSPISLTVYVPYTWGLVTQNPFGGHPVPYGSGWHWAYPWESASEEDNISLEERVQVEEGLTMDSTSGSMTVNLSFQWRPDLARLEVFRRMEEETTVERGFFEPLERFVSTLIAEMTGEEARKHQSIMSRLAFLAFKGDSQAEQEIDGDDDLKEQLDKELKRFRKDVRDLEEVFGIFITQVNVSDIDYPEEVRKAMAAKAEGRSLIEVAKQSAGVKTDEEWMALTAEERKEYREEARILSGNSSEHILNIKGDRSGVIVNAEERQ